MRLTIVTNFVLSPQSVAENIDRKWFVHLNGAVDLWECVWASTRGGLDTSLGEDSFEDRQGVYVI